MTFDDFNFEASLLEGLHSMGYEQPTPIQEQTIPVISNHKDLIACAQTGTGKTAAYLLPIIDHILRAKTRHLNTLIIGPTRELVLQIDQQIDSMAYFCNVSSIAIYGGSDGMAWDKQKRALNEGADIVCATPGRLIALLQMGDINFEHLQHLVLDEADRMLDMGFFDDIKTIISYLPEKRQTLLLSATMPSKIRELARTIMHEPEQINIAINKPPESIIQQAYIIYDKQKEGLLKQIIKNDDYQSMIIFSSTRENVKILGRSLKSIEPNIKAFHSDLEQPEREEIMQQFKNKQIRILIGTDILSRGIDVEGISLIVNYDAPGDPEDYIHRIGRTARASKAGVAITFVNPRDQGKLSRIEDLLGYEITKMPVAHEFGECPEYNPEANKKMDGNRRSFKGGRNKGRGGDHKRHSNSTPRR